METTELIIGPNATKKVIVASHERAGTHFLMNTLAYNFGYVSAPWIDIDIEQVVNPFAPENFMLFLEQFEGKPVLNTFKTHFQADFFLPILDKLLSEYWIFYIYRRGSDVMESFTKHLNSYPWDAGPKVSDGEELSRTRPAGYLMRYQKTQLPNMWARFLVHNSGWKNLPEKYRDRIIYVGYEDLNERFEQTVRNIGVKIDRGIINIFRPSKFEHVMTPERKTA